MQIRHCVEENNVDENLIIKKPEEIRHIIAQEGKIKQMSGFIDPRSHLNLDYTLHRVTKCVIAKKFEIGSELLFASSGFIFAMVTKSHFEHYGYIDYTKNLTEMIDKVNDLRNSKSIYTSNIKKCDGDKSKVI
jgi:type III secretory pathway component EscU